MNANARAWLDELESGRYRQGQSRLRTGDSFCCLGVACQMAVGAGVIPPPERGEDPDAGALVYTYAGERFFLPAEVQAWLGMRTRQGFLSSLAQEPGDESASLANMNDAGATFAEIAAVARESAPDLFLGEGEAP